jgi:hypothetical protein
MLKSFTKNKYSLIFLLVIFLAVSFGVLGVGNEVLAQSQGECAEGMIPLQVSIPGIGKCVKGFPEYVQALYNLFIGVVGILAVIMIMVGGFQWLLAAGNMQKITGAKTTIISAVMGLVLALTSYTILNLVNPQIIELKLGGGNLNISTQIWQGTGFCTADMSFTPINDEDKPICGQRYNITSGDEQIVCMGYSCEEDSRRSVCVLSEGGSTNPENVASCQSSFMILGQDNYGYSGVFWQVTAVERYCGELFYRPSDNLATITKYCTNNRECVIIYEDGVNFTINKDQVNQNGEIVGSMRTTYCY